MQDFAKGFYDGTAWRKCRESFIGERLSVDGGLCQRCHKRLGYIVHHRIELTAENITDPEISLNHELLEYLCLDCHNLEPGHFLNQPGREKKYFFDEDGEIRPVRPPG